MQHQNESGNTYQASNSNTGGDVRLNIESPGTPGKIDESEIDVTSSAMGGFILGYCLPICSLPLCCIGGNGRRTTFLRKGLCVGNLTIVAVLITTFLVIWGVIGGFNGNYIY